MAGTERAKYTGNVPYYGANGQVGWIDRPLFDQELVLVVEDETFVGRRKPFSYLISGPAWVNNHAHVLKAKENVLPKYLAYALSYYPFTPLTTGSTGRRKLTQGALMSAVIQIPALNVQKEQVEKLDVLITATIRQEEVIANCILRAIACANPFSQKPFQVDSCHKIRTINLQAVSSKALKQDVQRKRRD